MLIMRRSLANGFSYWQYQDIGNATKTYFDDMSAALGHVQEVTGGLDKVHFMNGGKLSPYLDPIEHTTNILSHRNRLARHRRLRCRRCQSRQR